MLANLSEFIRKPQETLAKVAKLYAPGIMLLKLGQSTTVIISCPNITKEILQTNDLLFSDRTVPSIITTLDHHTYSLPFLPICPLWKDLKKICNEQLFSNKVLDLSQGLRRKKLLDLLDDMPLSFTQASSWLDKLIDKRLELREEENYVTNNDILDALLDVSQEDSKRMDRKKIRHFLLDLLVAGTDTTAYGLERTMTEVLNGPEVMFKAKQELEENIGRGNPIDESDIAKLPYLQAIVKESLRLHPPAPKKSQG
ncbi:hypothetical protein PIB30_069051 [Stylosanthes scabra]|uniref:Cytochrome P450 n=1 Tax=Stylosanthes scabra TaxID=79078 RepID=A0ABU6YPG3_9FABA|nr:hypothetical protein [Stylosanthes scabra]